MNIKKKQLPVWVEPPQPFDRGTHNSTKGLRMGMTGKQYRQAIRERKRSAS